MWIKAVTAETEFLLNSKTPGHSFPLRYSQLPPSPTTCEHKRTAGSGHDQWHSKVFIPLFLFFINLGLVPEVVIRKWEISGCVLEKKKV